jgi:cell division protease FtsH
MFRNRKPNDQNKKSPLQNRKITSSGCLRSLVWIIPLLLIVFWSWNQNNRLLQNRVSISYSTFRNQVVNDNVAQIKVSGEEIQGTLIEPAQNPVLGEDEEPTTYTEFVTYFPAFGDDELNQLLREHNVEITAEPQSDFSWWTILFYAVPIVFMVGLGFVFFRQMQQGRQGIFNMGKSRAQRYNSKMQRVTFDDVAGTKGPKQELEEIIEFLKKPDKFQSLGGEIPKGVLLVGAPGTGKTLLARAVAGEAEVPFFNITGSDFMEMFVGVGASRVRDLFQSAIDVAPSIIFIDELDSIGRRRGAGLGGGHDEREQTLNQLLSEMDGFTPNENVIVMAATNRPDILDPALLRPGRFDRRITVDLPTMKERLAILKIHSKSKPLGEGVELEKISRSTPGFSGADLENILNEAALLAARKDKKLIEWEDIEEARDKVLMGLARESLTLTDEERKLLAYHEAGHTIVAAETPHADPIHKVTIVPRGRAMGFTQQLPERDRYLYKREYLLDRLAVMMGGRAAETLVFDTATSGAENDLKEATRLARKMVLNWGMSDKLRNMGLSDEREQVFLGEEIAHRRSYSDATARVVDEEIKSILNSVFDRATKIIKENRKALDRLAEELIEEEEVSGEKVREILDTR